METAAQEGFGLALISTTFLFGLRHGVDWDHIAAITDITSSQTHPRASMRFATLYAAGHAGSVLVLGLLAIELGARLPGGVDRVLERFVGITLLALGAYVFYALIRHGRDFRMRSRWMLIFSGARRAIRFLRDWRSSGDRYGVIEHNHDHTHEQALHASHDHSDVPMGEQSGGVALETKVRAHRHRHGHSGALPADPFMEYGAMTCVGVGMLHGIGAETPTQVLLFLSAVGAGGRAAGAILLSTFLIGLFVSNSLIALASTFGFLRAGRNFLVYAAVALVTGTLSLALGLLLLFGRGSVLPPLLG